MRGTTWPPPSTGALAEALSCLPHLESLSLLQKEPSLQPSAALPCLQGMCALPALRTLSLAGPPQLLLQAARQVPGWGPLRSLRLEAVRLRYDDEQDCELHHLLAAMEPGSPSLASFACAGHSYVSDGCVWRCRGKKETLSCTTPTYAAPT